MVKGFLPRTTYPMACLTTFLAGCCLIGSGLPLPTGKDIEPNDDAARAVLLTFDESNRTELSGNISGRNDVDVYDLGPVVRGDRIILRVRAASPSSLDALAALFDEDINLINYNDDEDYDAGKYDSAIDHIVRHDSEHCYFGITGSEYASLWSQSGSYAVEIEIIHGGTVPAAHSQTVLLDFDGASVDIPGSKIYNIGAFDAGQVDSRLEGKDAEAKQNITSLLEGLFSPYDIDFVSTDDAVLPPAGTYSRVVFGDQSTSLFGLAQGSDHYNADTSDEAIIFTDDWTHVFSFTPSIDAVYQSIANVAAHELGHLLGLEHTADIKGLMDASGSADTILVPQEFRLSPLLDEVFPFGWQDADLLLLDTLGPAGGP